MILTKANAKENPGKLVCFSITKAQAKINPQIFICNRFCVDGTIGAENIAYVIKIAGILIDVARCNTLHQEN